MALLSNPVLQGLLGGGGPNAIRARAEQQAAAMAPRGGGGMMGAPSPIVVRDSSGAEIGQGLAGLGQGIAALGQARQAAKQKEAEDAAINQYVDSIQDPAQRKQVMALAAMPQGRQLLMGALAKQAFPTPGEGFTLGEGQTRFDASGKPVASGPAKKDAFKLYGSDKTGYYTIETGADGKPSVNMMISPAGREPTSLQQDYEYAKKQFNDGTGPDPGSFTQFVSSTRATIEKAPTGYERTPEGMRPIAGGPADPNVIKQQEAAKKTAAAEQKKSDMFPKAQSALNALETNSTFVMDTIDKALGQISPFTTGYGNLLLSGLPQTEARDLERNLETIKANIGFDRLQQMRDASPTGGALGQVSEMENRLLQAVQGSLDPTQSTKQLRENLSRIKKLYQNVLDERRKAFQSDYGDMLPKDEPKPTDQTSDEQLRILIDKYAGEQ